MDRFIKSSAIPFGGYLYQNFIGLKVLLDWLEDPSLYEWVAFEADVEDNPKGLDDIVAKRVDTGQLVLLQVKFTVDPHDEKNRLSWDWLLKHKPKGKSLIQKWAQAFFAIGQNRIEEAALITNREPDREFEACLNSTRVTFGLVPESIKSKIITQLGSEVDAARFFDSFDIRHSYQGYESLDRTLRDRYVPKHTDSHGWYVLRCYAIDWAVKANCPPPDGRITLSLLRGTLSTRRPQPLAENFRVPDGYLPPNSQFDDTFLQRILIGNSRVAVLCGSPGQGKSTYLSHICRRLQELNVPYIRHHYFLSLSETEDRLSFLEVSNTLMHQIEVQHGEQIQGLGTQPENLRKRIAACATAYARLGKRFVVIVDGLDHVWRENDKNREPLEHLFRHLLPVPENSILVLGTQRVGDEQLPSQLPIHTNQNDWIPLPLMSLVATKNWLHEQASSGRFEVEEKIIVGQEDSLTAIAEAFHEISKGHPLHLTYSLVAAIKQHRTLTPSAVREMPDCPDGDIRTYYRSLWIRLSNSARDALHLIAGAGFTWPNSALEECLGASAGGVIDEIGHLLYLTEAGFMPFHGSLLTFISDEPEHNKRLASLMPSVVTWLETKAPPYLQWGWLWLGKARTGNTEELLNNPSREWVVSSLCNGYPESQIEKILNAAESLAFERGLYARAIRLRWLNVRMWNGIESQLEDFDRVYQCALTLTNDDYPLRNLSANFYSASIDELHTLALQYELLGRRERLIECQEEIQKRLNDRIQSGAYDWDSLINMSERFLELITKTGMYDPKRITDSIRSSGELSGSLFRFFVRELSKRDDVTLLLPFLSCDLTHGMRRDLELQIIRVAGYCKAHIDEWAEFERLKSHPVVACWALIYSKKKYKAIAFALDITDLDRPSWEEKTKDSIETFLHGLFFHALAGCLESGGIAPPFEVASFSKRSWMNTAVGCLLKMAGGLGAAIAQGNYPDFAAGYRILATEPFPRSPDDFTDYYALRRVLLAISADIFLLLSIRQGRSVILETEWLVVSNSRHFDFSEWRAHYLGTQQRILEDSLLESEIKKRLLEEESHVTQFNERTLRYLELCELALYQQLRGVAQKLLRKTVDCVLGYRWRRDMTVFYVLDAIAAVATVEKDYAVSALTTVSSIVEQIDVLTDGDDTVEAKFDLSDLLVDLMPRSFAGYYEHLLKTAEWYKADCVFSSVLSRHDLSTPLGSFIASTVWDSHGIGALRDRVEGGQIGYRELIARNASAFGLPQEDLGKERYPGSTSINEEHDLNIEEYGPDALQRLLADFGEKKVFSGAKKALREWFDLWERRGYGSILLGELQPFLKQNTMPYEVENLLDSAFELSLRLEGKRKAYRWIVAAQIHRNGWDPHYYEKETHRRFEVFASNYRNKWQNFILETCRPASQDGGERLVIPHNRLIQFLIAVGQVELAKGITDMMVSILQEEMVDQPLKTPSWLTED